MVFEGFVVKRGAVVFIAENLGYIFQMQFKSMNGPNYG